MRATLPIIILLATTSLASAQFNYNIYAHPKYVRAIEKINNAIEDIQEQQIVLLKNRDVVWKEYHKYDSLSSIAMVTLTDLKKKKYRSEPYSEEAMQLAFIDANNLLTKKNNLDEPIYAIEKAIEENELKIMQLLKQKSKWEARVAEEKEYR